MTLDRREDSETERRVRYRVTFNANVSSTPWVTASCSAVLALHQINATAADGSSV